MTNCAADHLDRAIRMRARLVARLAAYCGDPHVAEEVAQDVLLTACQQGDTLAEITDLWSWLWRVAVNRTHSHYRMTARYVPWQPPDAPAEDDVAEEVATRLLLLDLAGRERTAVWLRRFQQLTVQETAAALGCAPGTVRSLTSRGSARLRRRLAG